MPIDDPIDQIMKLAGPGVTDGSDDVLGTLMQSGGAFSPIVAVVAAVSAAFNTADKDHRVATAIRAICMELYDLRDSLPANADEALKSKWFRKAVRVVMDEAASADDEDEAAVLALVAVHGCFPDVKNAHRQKDLASYLRDLSKLGIADVQMLQLLCDHYEAQTRNAPNLNFPDMFAEGFNGFRDILIELGIHPDDGIAMGARLSGLGLAFEVIRNNMKQSPSDVWFRPTLRGYYLLSLLRKAEASIISRKQH